MVKVLFLLSAFVYAIDFDSMLIGGKPVPEGEFPQVVAINSQGSGCTATLVGPRVLVTAAHCARNGATVTFSHDGHTYRGVASRNPLYPRTDADFNLVKLSEEVVGVAPIHVNAEQVQVNDEVTLMGYGCQKIGGGDGKFGELRYGIATVKSRSGYDLVLKGGAALCFGDSGGPGFVDNQIVSINSKGNIRDTSYCAELDKVREWMSEWATKNQVDICGVTPGC